MKSSEIRNKFLNFFNSQAHIIVPSAPIVNKNDPSLLFVNAGMNPFKDYFLGNQVATDKRVVDSQKCLRVSGKHNDLEEVGRDGYHHTMFEMLGNWSFGDYFKQEAIDMAWVFLVDELKISKDRLYASVFGGEPSENLERDSEAEGVWLKHIPSDRIVDGSKKDNFWEMGETGPCGPCSEIHVDLRSNEEREKISGAELVNKDHPEVIEIWNLVFIQYNRKANGELENLPEQHIDTGMGLERLTMVMQSKTSSYDTDLFQDIIEKIEIKTGFTYSASYEEAAKTDLAMRVISDHLRAVSFAIADSQLPSNTGAGYVIRRILRRAIRYYYSYLDIKEPFIYTLLEPMRKTYLGAFPELDKQADFISNVIKEEEKSFLSTLSSGLRRLDNLSQNRKEISGKEAFELYDTYGFPFDLTKLILDEQKVDVDETAFLKALEVQKNRSKADAHKETGDWQVVKDQPGVEFIGYDYLSSSEMNLLKFRTVQKKKKNEFHLVLSPTPFYPEGGGQVGDTGFLQSSEEKIRVINTFKENDLIIHVVDRLPENMSPKWDGFVDQIRRELITSNHSATHLLHAALREVLGRHVEQKGSLVQKDYFRFDFSHFQKMTDEEVNKVESIVNTKIRENISLNEQRQLPLKKAQAAGAMMLFGEKYGDSVRMITFDPDFSVELCGGCHVPQTGTIGWFKIKSESAIAAGVRRIECLTGSQAQDYIDEKLWRLEMLTAKLGNAQDPVGSLENLLSAKAELEKKLHKISQKQAQSIAESLLNKHITIGEITLVAEKIEIIDSAEAKTIAFSLLNNLQNAVVLLGFEANNKAQLVLAIDKDLVKNKSLDAGRLIRTLAKHIQGGGGGQPFFATAGGKNPQGIQMALDGISDLI